MIKLFICDSDGCLTDGGYYIFSNADTVVKRYYTRDFYGMQQLQKKGITVVVLSQSTTGTEKEQCRRAGGNILCLTGVQEKYRQVLNDFVGQYKWDEIAYMGDDLNDKELLTAVGMAACPMDAEDEIVELVRNRRDGYVINRPGGCGCVRRFANMVLKLVEESYNREIQGKRQQGKNWGA